MGGGSYVGNAATFLIGTLFGIYILLVMLRFVLQWLRADFYNPVSQFIFRATEPALRPLQRVIPRVAGLELSPLLLMLGLKVGELWLSFMILGHGPRLLGLLVLALAHLMSLFLHVFLVAIFAQVVLSWVNPGAYNPVTQLIHRLTEPLLGRARRLLPPLSGLDLSPILVLIGLQLVNMLLIAPITDLGRGLL